MPETQKNVEIIECENWNDFRNRVVNDHSIDGIFQKGVFLFRGQAYESWKLDTTFDRMYKGYKKSEKNARADELLSEFIYECEYDDILENLRTDRLYMLALGQHNGLPTRLLDWSESPFVASLFAYSAHVYKGYKAEERVAVWSLDTRNKAWSEGCGCQIVRIVATGNERIRNQQGRFTYLRTPDENLESYVDKFGDGEVCLRNTQCPLKILNLQCQSWKQWAFHIQEYIRVSVEMRMRLKFASLYATFWGYAIQI